MVTTLERLIDDIGALGGELTIYAEADPAWSGRSRAVACAEPEDGGVPRQAAGMTYLLEVRTAKEVLELWSAWRDGRSPSPREKCEAVIYYAMNDTYVPV